MLSRRVITTWLLVIAALFLVLPAAAMATGPSAGDNEYTDPLANQSTHPTSGGSHSQTGSSTPTASSSSGTTTTPLSSSPGDTSTTSSTSSTGTTTSTSADPSSSRTLPRTGFDAGLAAAIGVSMIGLGLVTRRRVRAPSR